jgi:hypothetical protein
LDRVVLVTPTFESNKTIWEICKIDKTDVFEPTKETMRAIEAFVTNEADEWDRFLNEKREYERMNKDLQSGRDAMWTGDALLQFMDRGWLMNKRPVWKYSVERAPRLAVVIDDCLGTQLLLPSGGLTNFCIKHRHVGRGLGISVCMLVQSYCAQGGIARPIRENTTLLCLFKLRDAGQRVKILEEADLGISEEAFTRITDYAWSKPFGFLTIDFAAKSENLRFRSGFQEIIQP